MAKVWSFLASLLALESRNITMNRWSLHMGDGLRYMAYPLTNGAWNTSILLEKLVEVYWR